MRRRLSSLFEKSFRRTKKKQECGIPPIPREAPAFSLKGRGFQVYVSDVYDGDTVKCIFFFNGEPYKWNCRLNGIDTPELRGVPLHIRQHGLAARDRVRRLVLGRETTISCDEFDKYGRLLVDLYTPEGNTTVNDILVREGLALRYDGKGPRPDWGEELILNV